MANKVNELEETQPELERIAVVVLGAPEGGISAMARTLGLLGATEAASEPSTDPARSSGGSGEVPMIAALNDTMLAALGVDRLDPLAPESLEPPKEFVPQAAQVLATRFDGARFIVLNDARTSPMLPFWRTALAEAGYRPVFIIVVRHPFEVAASVRRRCGRPRREAIAEWVAQMRFSEKQTRGLARMIVDFEALLAEWRTVIARLSTMIEGLLPISDAVQRSVDKFLRSASRHHGAALAQPALMQQDEQNALDLFELMKTAAVSGNSDPDAFDGARVSWERRLGREADDRPVAVESPSAIDTPKRSTKAANALTWLLISGAPRSGTSFLRAVVAEHPQVILLQEYGLTKLVERVDAIVDRGEAAQEDWDGAAQTSSEPLRRAAEFYRNRLSRGPVTRGGGDLRPHHFDAVARGVFSALAPGKDPWVVGDKMPMRGPFEDIEHLASSLSD
jgi:hypothetical protein